MIEENEEAIVPCDDGSLEFAILPREIVTIKMALMVE